MRPRTTTDPDGLPLETQRLSPDQRLRAIAALLARGVLRLRDARYIAVPGQAPEPAPEGSEQT